MRMVNRLNQLDRTPPAGRQALLASFCIEDQYRGVVMANAVIWNNIRKITQWVNICHSSS